jgi:glycerate kinase
MRAAFAVVICTQRLRDGEFRGTLAAEMATSARQAGVPCHAICAEASIELFTARIYDIQTIRTASSTPELRAAGSALAFEL